MGVVCKLLGHHRSRRRAYHVGNVWWSYCSYCGKHMERKAKGQWLVHPAGPQNDAHRAFAGLRGSSPPEHHATSQIKRAHSDG